MSIILRMSACACLCICRSVCVSVHLSVSLDEIGQSVCRSVSLCACLCASVCLNLSVTYCRECVGYEASDQCRSVAWLACTLLLLTSANRLIVGLSLSLQHSALRVTVVQPHRAPDGLLRQATPAAGLERPNLLPPVQPGTIQLQQASTNVAKLWTEAIETQLAKRRRRDVMHQTSPTTH